MKRKIGVVITARPSYSRIKSALFAISKHSELELQLIVCASMLSHQFGDVCDEIVRDGLKIYAKTDTYIEGNNHLSATQSTALGLKKLSILFEEIKPDIIITVGDRFETVSTALAATILHIPLVHVQGGECTGNIDEKIRHAITKLADFHFVATAQAKIRIIRMGENQKTVFHTGCPSIDLVYNLRIDLAKQQHRYLVVLQHPVTNEYMDTSTQIRSTLRAVHEVNLPVYLFTPNPDAGSDIINTEIQHFLKATPRHQITLLTHIDSSSFLQLVAHASCVVGNSSVGIRECSFLGVPTVNIGNRQQGRQRGSNVMDTNYDSIEIIKAIRHQIGIDQYPREYIYGTGYAGERMAHLLSNITLHTYKKMTY
jgi:UDP-hydrolysing UDP-N-acetyl-D-glucosamine 2-epimerase